MADKFTALELFAGAGGLALGLERANFESLALIEIANDAAATLKLNRPDWHVINDDIANISTLNFEIFFGIKRGTATLKSVSG